MITQMEINAIKSFLSITKDDKTEFYISADRTNFKVSQSTNRLLEWYCNLYRKNINNTKIGKSAIIHNLLKDFSKSEVAIFKIEDIDLEEYNKSFKKALQVAKKIFAQYCKADITTQDDAVVAIIVFTIIREFEKENGLKITNYADDAIEDETEKDREILPPVIPVVQPIIAKPASTIDDLFEDDKPLSHNFIREGK